MNAYRAALISELEQLSAAIVSFVPSDSVLNIAHGNWSFPGITAHDMTSVVDGLKAELINDVDDDLFEASPALVGFAARIQFLRNSTVSQLWGNGSQAVPALMITLDTLKRLISGAIKAESGENLAKQARALTKQLLSAEARVRDLTRRSAELDSMIQRVESANEAAMQLPEDLETLREGRDRLALFLKEAEADRAHISVARSNIDAAQKELSQAALYTAEVVKKADAAYSAATSQGLAAAFAERSNELGRSMYTWVGGLLAALVCGSLFGSLQLTRLAGLITNPTASTTAITINLLLSILSVGAPVWFAWLSTKQIGQRFRLAEDYAYKASVSKAYDGYRREAASIDPDLQGQLLRSALARLDEQPLRFVDPESHGSPWQEILSSKIFKDALKTVPDFSDRLTAFASGLLVSEKTKVQARKSAKADPSADSE